MDFVQKEVSQELGVRNLPPTSFALLPLRHPPHPPPPTWDPAQEGGGERSGGLSIPTWLAKLAVEGGPWTAAKGGMPGHAWPSIYLPCLFLSSYTNPPFLKKKKEKGQRELQTTWQSLRVPLFSGQRILFEVGVTSKPPNSKFPLPRPFRDRELPPLPNQGQP